MLSVVFRVFFRILNKGDMNQPLGVPSFWSAVSSPSGSGVEPSVGIEFGAFSTFSALMLFDGWQEGHLACKKLQWWGAGIIMCLGQGADLHS